MTRYEKGSQWKQTTLSSPKGSANDILLYWKLLLIGEYCRPWFGAELKSVDRGRYHHLTGESKYTGFNCFNTLSNI